MIELGLARITRLLHSTPQPWKAIHVAGTNGKGSTCAYLSALLRASGRSCAVFSSPHLVDRWDCLSIDGRPVAEKLFRDAERLVQERDRAEAIGASEFELLTATAFEIMARQRVEYGVIEVGMGGALDATNALKHKAVAVITKIGLDHQFLLGNTVEEIAAHKAGIMQPGAPCVVDASNSTAVLAVIDEHALAVGARVLPAPPQPSEIAALRREGYEPHQIQNIITAVHAFRAACPHEAGSLQHLLPALRQARVPGRLQRIDRDGTRMLLDGAHNVQSAQVLAQYVDKHLRADGQPVTWVLAASEGKDVGGILEVLLKPKDVVTAVRFGPVDGMPWVRPQDPRAILAAAEEKCGAVAFSSDGEAGTVALEVAPRKGGPVVVAGSLYLVSDVLRYMRSIEAEP